MSLRVPQRFYVRVPQLPQRGRGTYTRTATSEPHDVDEVDGSQAGAFWFGCWNFLFHRQEIRRRRRVAAAIETCEFYRDRIESQKRELESGIDSCSLAVQQHVKAKNTYEAMSKLRQKKQKNTQLVKLQTHLDDLDRKLIALNELLTTQDVIKAVRTVAVAMEGIDVSGSRRTIETASETILECSDEVNEMTDALDTHQQLSMTGDEEALVEELEAMMNASNTRPHPPSCVEDLLESLPGIEASFPTSDTNCEPTRPVAMLG